MLSTEYGAQPTPHECSGVGKVSAVIGVACICMSVLLTADAVQATDASFKTPGPSSVKTSRSNAASIMTEIGNDGLMEGAAAKASPLTDSEHPSGSTSGLDTSSPESNGGGGENVVAAGLETGTSAHIDQGAMRHRLDEASALAAEAAQDQPSQTDLQETTGADSEQQLQNDSMAAVLATQPTTQQVPSSSAQATIPVLKQQEGSARPPQHTAAEEQPSPIDTADQFSIEIIRCRAVCPDWRDVALVEASTTGRPDTLVLGIPYLLLQLPPKDPAQHPRRHPVQVSKFPQVRS